MGAPILSDAAFYAAADRRSFLRAVTCATLAAGAKGAQRKRADTLLRTHWGDDSRAAIYLKASVDPPPGLASGWPSVPSYELLPLLAPSAASARLLRRSRSLDLEGVHHVIVPSIPYGGRPSPVFIGEANPAPAVLMMSNAVAVGPMRKILIAASLTAELEAVSAGTAEAIIGQALALATEQSVDGALFSTNADDGTTPGGILHGLTAIASGGSKGAQGVSEDVGKIADAINKAGVNPDTMVLVTNAAMAVQIKTLVGPKFDYEVFTSLATPDGEIVGVVPDALLWGYDGAAKIDTSKDVAMVYQDTPPVPPVGAGGVVGSPLLSAFQMDLLVLRVRAKACWTLRPGAAAYVTGAAW
jgi:hypothetical protein